MCDAKEIVPERGFVICELTVEGSLTKKHLEVLRKMGKMGFTVKHEQHVDGETGIITQKFTFRKSTELCVKVCGKNLTALPS
jgi:hypothetical protein